MTLSAKDILSLHLTVPVLFWPVLWAEIIRANKTLRSAHKTGFHTIDFHVTRTGRIHVLVTPLARDVDEALHRALRAPNVTFPTILIPNLFGQAPMPIRTHGPRHDPVEATRNHVFQRRNLFRKAPLIALRTDPLAPP